MVAVGKEEKMEDQSQRSRPESSNSANTRMTPTSSNSSSAHLPARSAGTNGTRAPTSGGASLLQERLRERKVESARQSRRRSIDLSNGEKGVQSSPVKGSAGRGEERRSSVGGVTAGKGGMGIKQMEEVCIPYANTGH